MKLLIIQQIIHHQIPVVEIKYDNADITNNKKKNVDDDKLKKFMTNMQGPSEEVNVVKSDVIATPIEENKPSISTEISSQSSPPTPPSFSFDNLYSNMNNSNATNSDKNKQDTTKQDTTNSDITKSDTTKPDTTKPDTIKPLELIEENKSLNNPIIDIPLVPKSPRKEIVTIKNEDDIDETSFIS